MKPNGFLRSALAEDGAFFRTEEILSWLASRGATNRLCVERIPFRELGQWVADDSTGDLVHRSGKFFRVHGARVRTTLGRMTEWDQPIIDQPEIGILGIVAKEFDGVLHFLMQAKVEPGNVDGVQLTPTVQATRSNYTQVHQGTRPPYVDYFLQRTPDSVLVDQLQPEQGSAFLRKRNRNMIVEVRDDVPVGEEHVWMTLGQVKRLLRVPNLVSMDARTVLSCIPLIDPHTPAPGTKGPGAAALAHDCDARCVSEFGAALLASAAERRATACRDEQVLGWLTDLKCRHELSVERIGLDSARGWTRGDLAIAHDGGSFFEVVAVRVEAVNREVTSWDQPLVKPVERGLVAFLVKEIGGVLHFLAQARIEPGNLDLVSVGATVQVALGAEKLGDRASWPPFADRVLDADPADVVYSCIQSEEGGRFFCVENEYRVVRLAPDEELPTPDNYLWMSLRQLMDLLRHGLVNVEARSLLACLQLSD